MPAVSEAIVVVDLPAQSRTPRVWAPRSRKCWRGEGRGGENRKVKSDW